MTPVPIPDLEQSNAQDVLARLFAERGPERVALACSFQKEEAVLIDMLLEIEPRARVFTIDTGVLFPETYGYWRELEQRYGLRIEVFDALDSEGGGWTAQRCCGQSKVAALDRALAGLDAWITGMRREQAPTRAAAPKLDWDARRGVWKASPLADWTDTQVWAYIAQRDLPYNPLHDQGYASIGCVPCTLPGAGREGRWARSDKTECGLHVDPDGGAAQPATTGT
jgi:phosphoadenosine phosphosulfate reductase